MLSKIYPLNGLENPQDSPHQIFIQYLHDADIDTYRILNSRLFKFIVGEEVDDNPTEFHVHQEAIAQLSEPLYALTKGRSAEARAGSASLKDVTKDTFELFAQFAYTGDYSIPKTKKRNNVINSNKPGTIAPSPPNTPIETRRVNGFHGPDEAFTTDLHDKSGTGLDNEPRALPTPEKIDDDVEIINLASTNSSRKNKKKKGSRTVIKALLSEPELEPGPELAKLQPVDSGFVEPASKDQAVEPILLPVREEAQDKVSHTTLTADFQSLSFPLSAPRDNYEGTCEPATHCDADQSYSNILIGHASIYVLGDSQLIEPLKELALYKLHKTLCAFQLDDKNIGDITDLARYAYSIKGREVDEQIVGLRGLVCQYIAIHAVELSLDINFMNLLAGGGQIVKDFFRLQLQRVN
jgi:hypothetical protein